MNLLPKSEVKFAEKDYWDSFFKNRENKEFEWYGEYPELCSHLHKYIKTKDNILVVGCGNSLLSSNLYDVGCRSIFNIDVSTVVVKQMKQLHRERTEMKYEVMDALNTTFENESFSVVLDKGTLDALMPQDSPDDVTRGRGLLAESSRVLRLGGRYVMISLLQPHILRTVLEVYMELGWMIRVCRCLEVEERTLKEVGQLRMPVFMVICTKFRNIGKSVLEVCLSGGDKPVRLNTAEEMMCAVKEVQEAMAMCSAIQKQALQEEVELEFRRDGDTSPRYLIRVVDREGDATRIRSYGAMIVPHGREVEWMFGTTVGRQLLRKSSGFDRLAVISLRRDHTYPSLEEIQKELGSSVRQLAPKGSQSKIPYVTVGDGIGQRDQIFTGKSDLSGDFVVEDVVVDADRFRRLVFLKNQSVIQSEVKLMNVKKGNKSQWKVDKNHIACAHHCYMALGVKFLNSLPCSVLVLGLGGGGLCLFLRKIFPQSAITAVDIDPAIVDISKTWFGVVPDDNLRLEVSDGLDFLSACHSDGVKYDVIMIDVDCKMEGNAMSCPPPQFVEPPALESAAAIIGDTGILVINIVCRIESEKDNVLSRIRNKFSLVARYSLEEDVNEIVFATLRTDLTCEQWRTSLEKAAQTLNADGKKKLSKKENLLNLSHLLTNLTIVN